MKKKLQVLSFLLLCARMVLLSTTCLGQATFYFQNHILGLDAPVFDSEGTRLAGTNFLAMLYGGPDVDSLQPALRASTGQALDPAPFNLQYGGQGGYFGGPSALVPNVACGALAWLQVRAWDGHLADSYEEVVALDIGGYGESNLFQKRGGFPFPCAMLPTNPEPLLGLESFALREVIPEPGSTLLLLLGLPALLFFHRRRSL